MAAVSVEQSAQPGTRVYFRGVSADRRNRIKRAGQPCREPPKRSSDGSGRMECFAPQGLGGRANVLQAKK